MQMWSKHSASAYLKPGRLADVIAALQVMGAGKRPEKEIEGWAQELSRSETQEEIERWTRVFSEHPEFFLTYFLPGQENIKAALRWRYTNKLYDPVSGTEYTPEQKNDLSKEIQARLTTKPLASDAIQALMNTAIELHSRALAEVSASRWWVPVLAASFGFVGAIIGAFWGTQE